jgi:hypothetical protein
MIKAVVIFTLVVSTHEITVHAQAQPMVVPRAPERPDASGRYLFYLHGRIIEDQGADAVSPDYGRYEYSAIVQQLAGKGFTVISEVRAPNTDPEVYADAVVRQIQHLLASGVQPANVAVIGASKGAVIAMLISSRLTTAIRYVLMANCNQFIFKTFSLSLHGAVLSIYEASDELGQTCSPLFDRSPSLGTRREIRLATGLRHGFIYRPLEAWLAPAVAWAKGGA